MAFTPTKEITAIMAESVIQSGELATYCTELESHVEGLGADDIAYDNVASGLTATDVQAAIDEVTASSTSGVSVGGATYLESINAKIDEIRAKAAHVPLVASSSSGSASDISDSYEEVVTLSFVAGGNTARLSASGYLYNVTGGSVTAYVKLDISGVAESYAPLAILQTGDAFPIVPSFVFTGLQNGQSYTARVLSQQSGTTAGLSATASVQVETY